MHVPRCLAGQARGIATRAAGPQRAVGLALAGTLVAGGAGYGIYKSITKESLQEVTDLSSKIMPAVTAASATAQPSVRNIFLSHESNC